jgi:hypothetical protein
MRNTFDSAINIAARQQNTHLYLLDRLSGRIVKGTAQDYHRGCGYQKLSDFGVANLKT